MKSVQKQSYVKKFNSPVHSIDEEWSHERIAFFKEALKAKQQEWMRERKRLATERREASSSNHPDLVDKTNSNESVTRRAASETSCNIQLQKIAEALEKIDAGEYGICEDCGENIGIRRLEVQLTAKRCIDCKSQKERGGKWNQVHTWR